MVVKVAREQDVLWAHLSPTKVVRLWATWQMGEGDYLSLRDQLFEGESVASLFEKVKAYQEETTDYTDDTD